MEPPATSPLVSVYLQAVYRAMDQSGRWHSFSFVTDSGVAGDDPGRLPFVQPWAITTAWNPKSERLSDAENQAAQMRLVEAVRALGLPIYRAEGRDTHDPPAWSEESLLVERLELKPAVHLLRVFRQHAAVYCAGGRAGLLIADPDRWDAYPVRILGSAAGESP